MVTLHIGGSFFLLAPSPLSTRIWRGFRANPSKPPRLLLLNRRKARSLSLLRVCSFRFALSPRHPFIFRLRSKCREPSMALSSLFAFQAKTADFNTVLTTAKPHKIRHNCLFAKKLCFTNSCADYAP